MFIILGEKKKKNGLSRDGSFFFYCYVIPCGVFIIIFMID